MSDVGLRKTARQQDARERPRSAYSMARLISRGINSATSWRTVPGRGFGGAFGGRLRIRRPRGRHVRPLRDQVRVDGLDVLRPVFIEVSRVVVGAHGRDGRAAESDEPIAEAEDAGIRLAGPWVGGLAPDQDKERLPVLLAEIAVGDDARADGLRPAGQGFIECVTVWKTTLDGFDERPRCPALGDVPGTKQGLDRREVVVALRGDEVG